MAEKFDVIIVGAGVAGLAAGYTLGKAGLNVIIVERGLYPGSKNVMGGILYRKMMEDIIPEFWKEAPLERPIADQRFWLMAEESAVQLGYKGMEWAREPYNCYSVFRGKFDQWFAKKCIQAGALLINETVAEECIVKNNKVVGIRTGRADGELYADVVVLAEGVNSLLARELGFHKEWKPSQVALAVMELIRMPSEKIEDRFNLEKGKGATIEIFGDATKGMVGTGFIYTNKEHLSIGCGALLSQVREKHIKPYELLEYFKRHPMVKPLVEGGESVEYYAHLIPEGGYNSIPKMVGDGVLVLGDAAQLVNGIHREGSNLAMTSGRLAAEAIIKAKQAGEFNERALSHYQDKLRDTFVIKDLKKYRNASKTMEDNPSYFSQYIPAANMAMSEMLTVDGIPKSDKQKLIYKRVKEGKSLVGMSSDMFKLWRAMK